MDFIIWKAIAVIDADQRFGVDLELFYSDEDLQVYQEGTSNPVDFVTWFSRKHHLSTNTINTEVTNADRTD